VTEEVERSGSATVALLGLARFLRETLRFLLLSMRPSHI
jgi:hypothetical protein